MKRVLSERGIVSLLIVALAAGLLWSTFGLQFADLGGAFSPMFFPSIVLSILLGLAIANAVKDLMAQAKDSPIKWKPVLVVSATFIAYALLIKPLGFFISSVMVAIIILLVSGIRDVRVLVLLPLGTVGALVVLFNHVLMMPLPTSPFTWWF